MPRKFTRFQWFVEAIRNHDSDECLIWPGGRFVQGYGSIKFAGKHQRVHRVAFFLTHGHWPTPCARHTCDTPLCFNPRHVIEGTQKQNMDDMAARNRKAVGTAVPSAKLTEELVRQIRAEYMPRSTAVLAKKYGVDRKNIRLIVTGRAWKHVI